MDNLCQHALYSIILYDIKYTYSLSFGDSVQILNSLFHPVKCFQVPLFNILKKFDGESVTEVVRPRLARMRYRVTKLPQYLILHMRRFTKNNFFVEKNPTLGEHLFLCY